MFYVFIDPISPYLELFKNTKFKVSASLSFVCVKNCVKFQSFRCNCFEVGICWISSIEDKAICWCTILYQPLYINSLREININLESANVKRVCVDMMKR